MDSHIVAIETQDLVKEYRLYKNPVHRLYETFLPIRKAYHQPFRALDQVSLVIEKGETVGIIGKNGSGKSTLLQIICGIVRPTSGSIKVNGRISALLELGAGFNPEFSGRQNVYLNGSILGLKQNEIDDRLDDILSFADIGKFIDQPVKSYSSGMVVRLAFAVAISIEPEILIIDEALSVGDEAFQRKCFAKIAGIQERGGTILFVTHSAAAVIELCSRAIFFDQGELLLAGEPKQIVSRYHKLIYAPEERIGILKNELRTLPNRFHLKDGEKERCDQNIEDAKNETFLHKGKNEPNLTSSAEFDPYMIPESTVRYERKGARIEKAEIINSEGQVVNILKNDKKYFYSYMATFETDASEVRFGMLIKTIKGIEVSGYSAALGKNKTNLARIGETYRVKFPFVCALNPGVYFLNAGILAALGGEYEYLDRQLDIAMFRVEEKKDQASTGLISIVGSPHIESVSD